MELFASYKHNKLVFVLSSGKRLKEYPSSSEEEAKQRLNTDLELRREIMGLLNTQKVTMTWVSADNLPLSMPKTVEETTQESREQSEPTKEEVPAKEEVLEPKVDAPQEEPQPLEPQQTLKESKKEEKEVVFRDVEVKLSGMSQTVSGLIYDLEQCDLKIESQKTLHKEVMKALDKEQLNIKMRLYEARAGRVMTTVRCFVEPDYEGGVKNVVREDTGEVIETVAIPEAELQQNAFPPETVEEFDLQVAKDTSSTFDRMNEKLDWEAVKPGKIKKGMKFRIYAGNELKEMSGTTTFAATVNAKTERKTGVVSLKAVPAA